MDEVFTKQDWHALYDYITGRALMESPMVEDLTYRALRYGMDPLKLPDEAATQKPEKAQRPCGSCGATPTYTITLRGMPVPACLRHLNHWRTPAPDYTCPTACVEQNHPGREHNAWLSQTPEIAPRRLCRCGVTKRAHDEGRGCGNYRKGSRLRGWFQHHSVWQHIAAPVWLRVPEKHRWTVVHWLNKSQRRCWSDLVSDALTYRESDPCDTHVPNLRADRAPRCASVCDWMHPDHAGEHACSCYCGKFQFTATDGANERRVRNRPGEKNNAGRD